MTTSMTATTVTDVTSEIVAADHNTLVADMITTQEMHSSSTNALSGDVTLTNANTYYDGPSVTLGVGTWLVQGGVQPNAISHTVTAKLWNGTTVKASGMAIITAAALGPIALAGIVSVASGTETWKISAASSVATNGKILAAAPTNGAGNNASWLVAVKLAF